MKVDFKKTLDWCIENWAVIPTGLIILGGSYIVEESILDHYSLSRSPKQNVPTVSRPAQPSPKKPNVPELTQIENPVTSKDYEDFIQLQDGSYRHRRRDGNSETELYLRNSDKALEVFRLVELTYNGNSISSQAAFETDSGLERLGSLEGKVIDITSSDSELGSLSRIFGEAVSEKDEYGIKNIYNINKNNGKYTGSGSYKGYNISFVAKTGNGGKLEIESLRIYQNVGPVKFASVEWTSRPADQVSRLFEDQLEIALQRRN